MDGDFSVSNRPRARTTPTWGGVMPRSSTTYCAVRASPSRIRDRCFHPPGLLRLEPHSDGLRDRIWWGAGSNATAIWAAKLGMNLQSSTLKNDETGEAFRPHRSGPTVLRGRMLAMHASHESPSAAASSLWSTIATAPISDTSVKKRIRSDSSTRGRGRSSAAYPCTVLISDTVEQELGHPETHNAAKPNDAWWRRVRSGQCNPPVTTVSTMRASHRARFGHRRATARLWSVPLFPPVTPMDAAQRRSQIQVERPCTLGRLRIKFGGNCVGPH